MYIRLMGQLDANRKTVKLEDYVHSCFEVTRHKGSHALNSEGLLNSTITHILIAIIVSFNSPNCEQKVIC